MKKFKKVLAVLLAMTMVMGLAACGSDSSSSDSESSDEEGGSGDKLSVMIWDTFQEPGLTTILGEFTEETGIEAEIQVVKWEEYWTLLEAGAQGGSMPDVFWMHSNEAEKYMSNDMLLDLSDYIADSDEIDLSNYPDDIVELYTHDGSNYAIPKDIDTIALWYNKTMFDEAGIDYPDETWTWETYADVAAELTKDDGSQYGTAIRTTNNQDGYYNIIYSYNGGVINEDKTASMYDDPNTIEAMGIIERMISEGSMPSLETMSENGTDVMFTSGQVAMIPQGSWMLAAFAENEYSAENADVAVLPMGPDGKRVSIYNGLGWAADASGSNTADAWKLIEYLGSEAGQLRQAELGVTMSAYEGTSDKWVEAADFNLQAYLDMMDDMVIRPYSRNTITWEDGASESFKAAWLGEDTFENVLKGIADDMNATLAEE